MPDDSIRLVTISLQTLPTDSGFDILPINAGEAKGHGIIFDAAVLRSSLSMWDGLPCFLDHAYTGSQSVRNLAGALHLPIWNDQEQGIQAKLVPGGPGAADLQALRLAAKNDPALMAAVGFSAHLYIVQENGKVKQITKVHSVDCVIDPARGGKFLSTIHNVQTLHPTSQGDNFMTDELTPTLPAQPEKPITDEDTQALLNAQAATKVAENKNRTAAESLRQVRLQTCRNLLKVSLEASHLPAPSAARVDERFTKQIEKGDPFEPADLELAIQAEQNLVSALTASGTIQGPGRISNMVNSADSLEAAVSDLFGVPRDIRLQNVKPAHLTGIRELYHMLTGDWDMHGGYYGERIQLATTADFSGLVKNALNKIVAQQWDALGAAGYDWWEKISKVEHFASLNDITGTLIGTVGTLPSVAEGAEYTELAVGDSPETASFTKYGGYIPLTLELIDRDDTRRLKAYASELGSAARRKISALVSQVFLANTDIGPTMADGGALFNNTAVSAATGHANLLVTALGTDYAQWNIVALAMYNQPMLIKHAAGYYGTGPKMAIWPKFCIVPPALKGQAEALFVPRWSSTGVTAIASAGGPSWGGMVEVVVMPEFVEVDHWAAALDPNVAPAIIVGERFGLKPEIYTAGRDTDPAVFMNDEHRIKVRMFTAVLVQDFRPLHKENV